MIKYSKKYLKRIVCQGETMVEIIDKLLLRQIDEDNKRFLGYVGEDEVLNNDPHDVFEDADKIAKNELRAELRDKVNKNETNTI